MISKYDNPFYDNHVFNKEDLKRFRLTKFHKLRTLFLPMLVQLSDAGTVFYKHDSNGRYYIFDIKDLNE